MNFELNLSLGDDIDVHVDDSPSEGDLSVLTWQGKQLYSSLLPPKAYVRCFVVFLLSPNVL